MTKQLRGGVASHQAKMDDEERLGIPDLDESVNQDRIRNRIEPPEDLVSGRKIFEVETAKQPEGDYEKDLEKLKTLTPDELDKLLTEIEEKSREGKGLFSKGNLLEGYAIDTNTLESLQSIHHDAVDDLVGIIFDRLRYSDPPQYVDLDEIKRIKRKIVGGFVYLEVPGFKTPIVRLWVSGQRNFSKENVEKIATHIKQERKLLPINSFFEAL